ncbi:MAG: M43 family zinc metalloprotease, partial [Crocinitomicaceae bacterium]
MKRLTLSKVNFELKTFLFLFALISFNSFSQQNGVIRCYTVEDDSMRHANDPNLQTNEEFEDWITKQLEAKRKKGETQLIINGVYQIPVVVHVIHNGEAIGTGTNISAAAVQSQIDVLNEDFRKLIGTAGYNTHPYGADTKIEFCLARRRPNGTAFPAGEDGINRVNRNTQGWGAPPFSQAFINGTIKPWSTGTDLGGWNPADYMNFWSANISGGLLGWAQFPTTTLGGMSCASQSVTTDGVVMLYSSIGKSAVTGQLGPYNEGRTATHEIGHWLGLRHIWGDGGCGVDDFCADTPLSDASNFGCPNTNSCVDPNFDPADMVQNYMDYSDDACMNIFTYDQMARMRIVLESSPIRASLITSSACIPPNVSDASIVNVLNPKGDNCTGSITPSVTIKNRGASNVTSATISYTIDGGTPTTFNWTGTITPNNTANVNLPAFTATLGVHIFKAYSTLPNGVIDPDPTYDTTEIQFAVSNGFQPDYSQDFESGTFVPDVRWNVVNPNSDCFEWIGQSCTSSAGVFPNDAAMMPNFGNATNQDEYLYTPFFILPCNATSAQIVFDKAYQRRVTGSTDRLRLQMSTDCGVTWTTTLYDQNGTGLQSNATVSNSYWIPSAAGDWDNVVINLTPYVTGTSQTVQFRFRGTNAGNGGNVYVDNFQFNAVTPGEAELAQATTNILDEGFYNVGSTPLGSPTTFVFTISNPGTTNLLLTGPISIVGASQFVLNSIFGTTTVPAGGSTTFSIDFTPTGAGPFTATVSYGTNDCDEGTYNFQITGSGSVTPPIANFTGNPTTICQGSTVTYTDASTGASSWAWTFPGGTPASATGVGPHTITYNTTGTYNAQLNVTNVFGSDPEIKPNYINVLAGTGTALPITQGFTATTFPPTSWSINNGGLASTWVRSATQGTAPTAGNSAYIDNFSTNTAGNIDDLVMIPANFTGLVSAQLQFDVAYARYSATYSDQLQVVVSSDCGQTFNVVYDKAGTALATQADQTAAYTAPTTWRQETVDLSAYVGSGKVDVYFRSISGYGQYLYIDNINLTGVESSAIANYTALPTPTCIGQTVTFTNTSTGATSWNWNFGAGATPATATGAGPHSVTYITSGTKATSLSINSGASTSNQNVVINPTPATPTITAGGATTFCAGGSVTLTSSSATGNQWYLNGTLIGGATAQTYAATATGNYTVIVTTSGCPSAASAIRSVTVNPTPATPTITAGGATTFCTGGSVTLTSSSATGNQWYLGGVLISGATAQTYSVTAAGNYTVIVTTSGCPSAASAIRSVTVNPTPATPTITAGGAITFCAGGSVTLTSSSSTGNQWSLNGTPIGVATAQTYVASAAGNYTVMVTTSGCPSAASAATTVTVNLTPATPTISAGGATTFCSGGSVTLTSSSATGNQWSLNGTPIGGATSQTYVASTAGNYTVMVTTSGCPSAASAATAVAVNPTPATPTISAGGAITFCTGGSVTLTSSSATSNQWSLNGTPIGGATAQTYFASAAGNYTVVVISAGCTSAASATTTVTVNPTPVITVGTVTNPSACATSTGSIQVNGSATGIVSWTGTVSGSSGSVTLPHTITGLAAGTYNISINNGTCPSN